MIDASLAPWWLDENPGGVHSPWVLHPKGRPWLLSWILGPDLPSGGPWGPTALQHEYNPLTTIPVSTDFVPV